MGCTLNESNAETEVGVAAAPPLPVLPAAATTGAVLLASDEVPDPGLLQAQSKIPEMDPRNCLLLQLRQPIQSSSRKLRRDPRLKLANAATGLCRNDPAF
jgi:hypothetical protein